MFIKIRQIKESKMNVDTFMEKLSVANIMLIAHW